MMEDSGLAWKVNGRRSEIAAGGPNPGRIPVKVPKMHPKKQNKRLTGLIATLNP
jgi:hypothetical protein